MVTHSWDPDGYLAYADERGRPFVELVSRIGASTPASVVDLGCGPGNLTRLLAERWPAAAISGIDSSPEMITKAAELGGAVSYAIGDVATWAPVEPVDVLVSNATLHWVPGHLTLLPRLVRHVRPGGWFAFQVPGNFDQPTHTIRRDLAAEVPYAARTVGVAAPEAFEAATYLEVLAALGCTVDAWETTYLHLLHGPDPVFTWVSATAAGPTLEALEPDLRASYEEEFRRRLAIAYPATAAGVLMPFRRVFVVAQVPA